jgi:DNA-binding protein H-NS
MKTPHEKAKELVEKFTDIENEYNEYSDFKQAKQCALIAVDELIQQNGELYLFSLGEKTIEYYKKQNAFLFDVKSEIKKL